MSVEFRIADTFLGGLTRLTNEEQKAVKQTAFDLQLNPASPGLSFHKLDQAKDKNFWSLRVSSDLRLIVHRTEQSLLLCYVDHHDKAYAWAERRKLATHPTTGAAQWVEIRETVQEVVVPVYVPGPLFAHRSDEELLGYGVPAEWLAEVRGATEASILELADHLPREAAEALLELAVGGAPRKVHKKVGAGFEHPDAQSRFRVMGDRAELERALESPWDRWTVFLHPDQRDLVERDYAGPARVSGSAGTGKTIVALHRAVFLARKYQDARVLLATFSDPLAEALRTKLRRLVRSEPRLAERVDVSALDALATRLYDARPEARGARVKLLGREALEALVKAQAAAVPGHAFSQRFLLAEWEEVVDAWQLATWEAYRQVPRLGRKTRLSEAQRKVLWAIFERVLSALHARGERTQAGVLTELARTLSGPPVYEFVVLDEAQDLGVAHVRLLAAMGAHRVDALFFAGDLGQRIFQQPFSWKSLGVDVRGRSRTLRVNYRTTHQIRAHADKLLDPELRDVDGNAESREGTVSVFNGPAPEIRILASEAQEREVVSAWLRARAAEGVLPQELGVFVRSEAELPRARAAVADAGLRLVVLDEHLADPGECVSVSTMHLAKGLEFRAVVAMACDEEVIPSQARVDALGDAADLDDVLATERQLLYVACTRARDGLLVTGVAPGSEFLADLKG
jgi:superfamily I DNA/RNA helicase/mRNA-degrading endonuclease RelE of RelBE toxin-antitoxin system